MRLLNLSQTSSTLLPPESWYSSFTSLLFCIHNNILKHSYLAAKQMNIIEMNWTKHNISSFQVFGALVIAKLLCVPIVMSYHTHVPM
jgi:hypothetical protein